MRAAMSDVKLGVERGRTGINSEIGYACGNDGGHLRRTAAFKSKETEPWADPSRRVCPSIGVFLRAWDEGLPVGQRDILEPLRPKIVDTSAGGEIPKRRGLMAADWLVRTYAPAWLDLAGLREHADKLYDLPRISEIAQAFELRTLLAKVSHEVNAEALTVDAAGWASASNDCWASAWAAAYDTARFAAHDLAWVSAASASRAAAGLAARATTRSLVTALQVSAAELVLRMARLNETPKAACVQRQATFLVHRTRDTSGAISASASIEPGRHARRLGS